MNSTPTQDSKIPKLVERNLSALGHHQSEKKRNMRWDLRFVDPIVRAFGSMTFLWVNLIVFIVWIMINTGVITAVKNFDPYPFEFLTFSVSLEAIFLSIIVLIGQNELQKDSDERAELDLHINLLAEREATTILKKLVRIEEHLGIKVGRTETALVNELLKDTDPVNIVHKISQAISEPAKVAKEEATHKQVAKEETDANKKNTKT